MEELYYVNAVCTVFFLVEFLLKFVILTPPVSTLSHLDSSHIKLGSLPYLCTKNKTMAPLHVATLAVQRELPKYEIIFSI